MLKTIILILSILISFNKIYANSEEKEVTQLYYSFLQSLDYNQNESLLKHVIKSISNDGSIVVFEDDMSLTINWWYRSVSKAWHSGDQVYISYDFTAKQCMLKHQISGTTSWGSLKQLPSPVFKIKHIPNGVNDPKAHSQLTLENGITLDSFVPNALKNDNWKKGDQVIILVNSDELYQVWNVTRSQIILFNNINVIAQKSKFKDILNLETRINTKVLQQPEAVHTVSTTLLNYAAGLKEKEKPIGVFLFLGSTGVGKTELAKALTEELYGTSKKMLRFDMSHFTESHSMARLIGSPPGYVNHEEGGQLTVPLNENPQRVVLLDEIEKAHPQVLKAFLPIFDEGLILDSKNNSTSCVETIFIMTSNLCGEKISELYKLGHCAEEILTAIEPDLIQELSPELYNRVEPILFKPLAKETMNALVDLFLNKLEMQLLTEKNIQLYFDQSLKDFLAEKGYHPTLGARPLKKLIEKRVLATLAYHIIKDGIEGQSKVILFYEKDTDSVHIQWSKD